MPRCPWATTEPNISYHDQEWGVAAHDDRVLFEFLILEGAQAGLSWNTILAKRENYRRAFARFNPRAVAHFGDADIARLMADAGIVRNRLKINAAISNGRAFLEVQKQFGSFDTFVWDFVGGGPRHNRWRSTTQVPARTEQSDALSKELVKRAYKFVDTT